MKLLKWEYIKENEEYVDEVYGIITVHAKAIIKGEKLLVITYKDRDQFPVSFDGMKIFKEVYRVKTLEELGFIEITKYNYSGKDSTNMNISIQIDLMDKDYGIEPIGFVGKALHKAIELKMIELGLWEEA